MSNKEQKSDLHKLRYVKHIWCGNASLSFNLRVLCGQAFEMVDPTLLVKKMTPVTAKALDWIANLFAGEIIAVREAWMVKHCATELRESGACDRWLELWYARAKSVVRDFNAPLLEVLLGDVNHHDAACVEVFQTGQTARVLKLWFLCLCFTGARLLGVVEPCGLEEAVPHEVVACSDALRDEFFNNNQALPETLRPHVFENGLMKQTEADAMPGRMTEPIPGAACWSKDWCACCDCQCCHPVGESDLHKMRLHLRFDIEQGRQCVNSAIARYYFSASRLPDLMEP